MADPTEPFPAPSQVAGRNYWTKGDIRKWRAHVAGLPQPAPQPDDENWLTSKQVKAFFGGVSDMWLHRRRTGKHPLHDGP